MAGEKKRKSKGKSYTIWMFGSLLFIITFKTSTIFFVAGMLPAFAATLIDKTPNKSYFTIVGGFNLAGVVPYMVQLWNSGNSMESVLSMFANPNIWLAMYGAAALGWGLILFLPSIIIVFLSTLTTSQLNNIQEAQKKLLEEWGPDLKKGE